MARARRARHRHFEPVRSARSGPRAAGPVGRHHDLSGYPQRPDLRRRQSHGSACAEVHRPTCGRGAEECGLLVESHESASVRDAAVRHEVIRAAALLFICLAESAANAPLYTQDDLLFLTHMIVHHEQALEMTALVPSRTQRDELIRFARYLDGAQRVEIDHMKGLLRAAADRGIPVPQHEMHGDPPMTGMLSRAQMAALAAAHGAEFERLWLEGMIYHHEGALTMGREQQQR